MNTLLLDGLRALVLDTVFEFFAQLGSRDADATEQLGLEERGNLHR